MLCKAMRDKYDLVAITNDIYTKEDQRLLTVSGALPAERIMGVETGGCPHTAIREDASINLEAIDRMLEDFPEADIVFVESGGDNLAATFSPELSDLTIYVIDVAAGEKIPRKGGPGITKSDLFVINKTDLAPYVGADLGVMKADTLRMRRDKPFVMTNLKTRDGLAEVVAFIERKGLLHRRDGRPSRVNLSYAVKSAFRRVGRAVECTGLENRRCRKTSVSSNLTLSARCLDFMRYPDSSVTPTYQPIRP